MGACGSKKNFSENIERFQIAVARGVDTAESFQGLIELWDAYETMSKADKARLDAIVRQARDGK